MLMYVVHSVDLTHRDDRVGVLGPAVDAVVLVPLVVVFRAVERVGTGTRRVQPAKNHPDLELDNTKFCLQYKCFSMDAHTWIKSLFSSLGTVPLVLMSVCTMILSQQLSELLESPLSVTRTLNTMLWNLSGFSGCLDKNKWIKRQRLT